jgi:hypothetical protein
MSRDTKGFALVWMKRTIFLTGITIVIASSAASAIERPTPRMLVTAAPQAHHWQWRGQAMPLADLPIWKTVRLDAHVSAAGLREVLSKWPFGLGDSASAIFEKALAEGRATASWESWATVVNLVVLSASEMGFEEENVRLSDVYARARELGLELCPAELGPLLRLQFIDQRLGDFVHIAMKPIAANGDLIDFTVANGGAGLVLIGGEASPERIVASTMRFVFVLPASTDVTQETER